MAIISVPILKDERVIAIAEVRHDVQDDIAFKWMNTVVSAVETIHGISLYGVMLVTVNSLPKIRGYIHIPETRTNFQDGTLSLEHLLLCPHQCITNIPVPKRSMDRIKHSHLLGNIAKTSKSHINGQLITPNKEISNKFNSIGEILGWRGSNSSDLPLFSIVDSKGKVGSFQQFYSIF